MNGPEQKNEPHEAEREVAPAMGFVIWEGTAPSAGRQMLRRLKDTRWPGEQDGAARPNSGGGMPRVVVAPIGGSGQEVAATSSLGVGRPQSILSPLASRAPYSGIKSGPPAGWP
ncbi:hypothetical protein PGQ11_011123 [Apiospora arundinis]|uniref:Uncharacterized protein n=1 Tax=Apiospora arundinis TaxID=335852 RepID=A0ABR2HZB7_9PEZI